QDALRRRVGDRERLHAQLLLDLQGAQAGRLFFHVRVDEAADAGGERVRQRLHEVALDAQPVLHRAELRGGGRGRADRRLDSGERGGRRNVERADAEAGRGQVRTGHVDGLDREAAAGAVHRGQQAGAVRGRLDEVQAVELGCVGDAVDLLDQLVDVGLDLGRVDAGAVRLDDLALDLGEQVVDRLGAIAGDADR